MSPEGEVVHEIIKSIRWAAKLLGHLPNICEVGPHEWKLLRRYRQPYHEAGWVITICSVQVKPYGRGR